MSHQSVWSHLPVKQSEQQSSDHQGPILPCPSGIPREALHLAQGTNRAVFANPSPVDDDPSFSSAYYFYPTGSEGSGQDTTQTHRPSDTI